MRGLTKRVALMIAVLGLPSCAPASGGTPSPPAQPHAPVMMFVGDSFTVGSGPVPRWQTYASQAARLMGGQPIIAGAGGTGFCNEGRAGRTFQRSFEEELAWRPPPDLLVISGGHNDRRWSAELVRQAAASLLSEVRTQWPQTRTVMVGPIWLGEPPRKAYGVRDAVAEAARAGKVTFLDPLRRSWPREAVLPDGVHPTLAGHGNLAAWLAGELL
ncbi:SGNH/GDSL hydrolase family protein [Nonomuraea sp. MG754425]|uniref:SGNH/GDSL hydrolase family protein n=1 Tax=Nonomuraea sp. MG754425 TaxID=2570319 RepID=UPI001F336A1D|nr:SGNH/GDSL hydrolase family protein [Nonomuraea sp. MG754425]MCF6472511.1 SGNH/GDSL hydrolase family protein [Nonomuraea sp. MG754425]